MEPRARTDSRFPGWASKAAFTGWMWGVARALLRKRSAVLPIQHRLWGAILLNRLSSTLEAIPRHPGLPCRGWSGRAFQAKRTVTAAFFHQLVLNFLPDAAAAVHEMRSRTTTQGAVSACVWDYGEDRCVAVSGMRRRQWIRRLASWTRDNASRSAPATLQDLFRASGLGDVRCEAIEIPTEFVSFDDYWQPLSEVRAQPLPTSHRSTLTGPHDAGSKARRDSSPRARRNDPSHCTRAGRFETRSDGPRYPTRACK